MGIAARVELDSISPAGVRLTSFEVTMHRMILAEWNTPRVFSRNAASSRAIPIERFIEQVRRDPAMPVRIGKNGKGMSAHGPFEGTEKEDIERVWKLIGNQMTYFADYLENRGVHKQWTNRLLEPWMWTSVVMSTCDVQNFFGLRDTPHAQPEMQMLAEAMKKAYTPSVPRRLDVGEWHIPFLQDTVIHQRIPGSPAITEDERLWTLRDRLKLCVGRNARISYLRFGEDEPREKTFERHDTMAVSKHWSPFEHAAIALPEVVPSGNFWGFCQYRSFFPGESGRPTFNFCKGCGRLLDGQEHLHEQRGCLPNLQRIETYAQDSWVPWDDIAKGRTEERTLQAGTGS